MGYTISKVAVTGGAGCIGLQVCRELYDRGLTVNMFDLHEQVDRVREYIPATTNIYYGSILDKSSLRDAIRGCDAVIHLAAYLGVRRTETNRLRCIEINIHGTQNVLETAVQEDCVKFVNASSSEVYGEPSSPLVREDMPIQPKSVYGVTKIAAEEMAKAYCQRYPHLAFTNLRYFNTFGPYQVAQFVIPKFLRNVLEAKPPIIYGDGSQVRSYCYAQDTARATVDALLSERSDGEAINVSNSENKVALSELAHKVIEICGKTGQIDVEYRRNFFNTDRDREREIVNRVGDGTKAQDLLGFKASISLEEGLRRLISFGPIHPKWATSDLDYMIDDSL